MKKISVGVLSLLGVCMVAQPALAHEVHIYEIKGVPYEFVVGSRNEPVVVDDKTGFDFELVRDGKAVVGAQNSLKVEMGAGNKKETLSFDPVYGEEGRYKTNFFATVATTLSYRVFGELEGTPIDLTFTCNPAGHPKSEESKDRIEVAPDVVRVLKEGAFGCPQSKESFGFPEPGLEMNMLEQRIGDLEAKVAGQKTDVVDVKSFVSLSVVVGVLAVMLGVVTYIALRRKKTTITQI